jgi:hypothetical protein
MKPGKYYVGDLCYVLGDTRWDEICELTIDGHKCLEGQFITKDGLMFVMYGTAYGDGSYYDEQGREYSVDSGTIGCVAIEDLSEVELKKSNEIKGLGNIIDFPKEFQCKKIGRNILVFGHIEIDTDPPYEGQEEQEEDYQ